MVQGSLREILHKHHPSTAFAPVAAHNGLGPRRGLAVIQGLNGKSFVASSLLAIAALTAMFATPAEAMMREPGFEPSIGLTRSQVESRFHEIDGGHTVFKSASDVRGLSRVLGADSQLYTIVEINGYPEVNDVQLVSVLDTASKTMLENQVVYDSLACGLLADEAAQNWCTGRILNTDSTGLVTATMAKSFGLVEITVRTYQTTQSKSSNPPVASINFTPP